MSSAGQRVLKQDQTSGQMNSTFSQPVDAQMVDEVNRYLEIEDMAGRDAYRRNLPEQRSERKNYSIGQQTEEVFGEPLPL